jgi:hypothetical protein
LSVVGGCSRLVVSAHLAGRPEERVSPLEFVVKALLESAGSTDEGRLVEAVAVPWFEIAKRLQRDPEATYEIDRRAWEEIIAGAYTRAGFDEVILTPRAATLVETSSRPSGVSALFAFSIR